MVQILVFGRLGCGKCDGVKNMLANKLPKWGKTDVAVEFFNVDEVKGRARACFFSIGNDLPVTLVMKDKKETRRFTGLVLSEEMKAALDQA